jgi:hypothetical protein
LIELFIRIEKAFERKECEINEIKRMSERFCRKTFKLSVDNIRKEIGMHAYINFISINDLKELRKFEK